MQRNENVVNLIHILISALEYYLLFRHKCVFHMWLLTSQPKVLCTDMLGYVCAQSFDKRDIIQRYFETVSVKMMGRKTSGDYWQRSFMRNSLNRHSNYVGSIRAMLISPHRTIAHVIIDPSYGTHAFCVDIRSL